MNEFITYLMELLDPFGDITAKSMFGGYGIYRHAIMFGLVADNVFYLKVDDGNRADYDARGLKPFIYNMKGKKISMSYYQVPDEAMENSQELCVWALKAYEAALRSAGRKKHQKKSES